jgi:hypothetical protein
MPWSQLNCRNHTERGQFCSDKSLEGLNIIYRDRGSDRDRGARVRLSKPLAATYQL